MPPTPAVRRRNKGWSNIALAALSVALIYGHSLKSYYNTLYREEQRTCNKAREERPDRSPPPPCNCTGPRATSSPSWTDAMESRYNRTAALEPVFRIVASNEIASVKCAGGGQYPLFMHRGTAFEHVCKGMEVKVAAVMLHIFKRQCQNPPPNALGQSRGLMLDVGSNLGYYGLLAMRLGCEALLFDVQPECQKMINNAIVVNNLSPFGRMIPFGVSSETSSFKLSSSGCDGRFPAEAHEGGVFDQGDSVAHVYPLDRFVDKDQPVLLMKVDTEGNERSILEGSLQFFRRRLVQNAIVEVTPGFWANVGVSQLQVAATFRSVADHGYTMISLVDGSIHGTPEKIFTYINTASFRQGDMWLTLDAVNSTGVFEIMGDLLFFVGGSKGTLLKRSGGKQSINIVQSGGKRLRA